MRPIDGDALWFEVAMGVKGDYQTISRVLSKIDEAPEFDSTREHGYWIEHHGSADTEPTTWFSCSCCCGAVIPTWNTRYCQYTYCPYTYCPYCGARMDLKEDD